MSLRYETYSQVVSALDKIVFFFTEHHVALKHLPAWVWDPAHIGFDIREIKQWLDIARAEIREAEDAERRSNWVAQKPFLDEDEILITCALRFDGWKYKELTDFDQVKALDDFFATGEWNISPLEHLTTFFLLQRGLFKWDLEYEPRNGKFWRAFRSLFFLVYDYEVPEAFKFTGTDSYDRWEYKYKPRLQQCVDFIRSLHENTQYED